MLLFNTSKEMGMTLDRQMEKLHGPPTIFSNRLVDN